MKKLFIVGNWKCNPVSLKKAKRLFLSPFYLSSSLQGKIEF